MKKTVLITGTSSGFGRETAKLFHQNGWNVIATMRSPEQEHELAVMDHILLLRLDVTDGQSIAQALAAGIARFGTIDVLVNNAGYGLIGVFESAGEAHMKKQYDVNVFGMMRVTQAVLPVMRANRSGVVINISSFGGITALPFGCFYNSSKFAVEGFSEALSHELAFLNIAVKIIEPGSVATNFRSSMEMIHSDIEEYKPQLTALMTRYAQRNEQLHKATAVDVATAIYQAATDGKPQLRYVVGEDAQYYIDLKMKNTESEFLNAMLD